MTPTRPGEGVLLIDKPPGPTSHDVVALARRALAERRIGHSGTLDPFASGLLLLLVGGATRLAEYLAPLPKEYVARARLGEGTTTDDPEGEVIGRSERWKELTFGQVKEALDSLQGVLDQLPPAYSAKKVRGRPAHRRVRAGEVVALEPTRVVVHDIELQRLDLPWVTFRVLCSTGTYVRSLARDVGKLLGVGAHLVALRRTRIGPFSVEDALPPSALVDRDRVREAWVPPLAALSHLPEVQVDVGAAERLAMGQFLPAEGYDLPPDSEAFALACQDRLVAVGEVREGRIRPRKVFPR